MNFRKSILIGYLLVAISAITFSAKSIFAKILYGYGVDPLTLLALRFSLALPFFWGLLFLRPSERVAKRDMAILLVSGIVGLYVAALADFYGLLYIDASLERIILYSYPAMVVMMTAFIFKERIDGRKIIAMLITYAGLFMVMNIFKGAPQGHLFGAGLVFLSAIVYAFSYVLTEQLGKRVSSTRIAAYSTTTATFAFVATWRGKYVPSEGTVWLILFVLAVVSTFIPVVTLAMGIKRVGASKAALISSVGPVATVVLASIFLGESMDMLQIAGMGLVLTGVAVIFYKKSESLFNS